MCSSGVKSPARAGAEDRDLQLAERVRVRKTRSRVAIDEEHERRRRVAGRRAADPAPRLRCALPAGRARPRGRSRRARCAAVHRRTWRRPRSRSPARSVPPVRRCGTITARSPSGTSAATGPTAVAASLDRVRTSPAIDVRREDAPDDRRDVADRAGRNEVLRDGRRVEHSSDNVVPRARSVAAVTIVHRWSDGGVQGLDPILVAADHDERKRAEHDGERHQDLRGERPAASEHGRVGSHRASTACRDPRHVTGPVRAVTRPGAGPSAATAAGSARGTPPAPRGRRSAGPTPRSDRPAHERPLRS